MLIFKKVKIRSYERGLVFKEGEFVRLLGKGKHYLFNPLLKVRVDVVSQRDPWLVHKDLDVIVKSGALEKEAEIIDLKDSERALVWIDKRFARVLGPGLYVIWKVFKEIRVETIDARNIRFDHGEIKAISASPDAGERFHILNVDEGFKGLFFRDGAFIETLSPGQYLFWKGMGKVKVYHIDMRESVLDISGQDIMSRDKVTLRMNAVVGYRVTDPLKSVTVTDDAKQALYRDAQLALRAVVGSFELDKLLTEKERVAEELENAIRGQATALGMEVVSLGIRDIILPGEMKELMNKVMEAQKAAEANLVMRREETAAMRSQANTAKILESNPMLMRLRELDILEKIAGNSKMSVILGEKGLAEKVINLL